MPNKYNKLFIKAVSLSVFITGIISIFQPFIDRISARIELLITPPEVQYLKSLSSYCAWFNADIFFLPTT
jgi:hypothetical protein